MSEQMKTKLIIVGGFLGAGKTSLLWAMAKKLSGRGARVGLVTNDQETGLVDTHFLASENCLVEEVSGSCFCCNFNGFADAITALRKKLDGEGIVFAEPVGSCTDLSATIMQPLKEKYRDEWDLGPLTVLADPAKIRKALDGWDSDASYIIYKQFEEADVILINKMDLLRAEECAHLKEQAGKRWPKAKVLCASVQKDEGLDAWFDLVMSTKLIGTNMAEVDYDKYAAGEAAYGWVNTTYTITDSAKASGEAARDLLDGLSRSFDAASIVVGHVKFIIHSEDTAWIGNITGTGQTKNLRTYPGKLTVPTLIVNGRAEASPEQIEGILNAEVERIFGQASLKQNVRKTLIPGRPKPTYRYDHIV